MGASLVKVLAFDCSTARGSLAVVEDGEVLLAETFECPRGRGSAFFQVLERAIQTTGKPDRIVVGIGPGSYNGLRTSMAAAEGLKLATGASLVGVASVRALPCASGEYVAVNDARGGVFYFVGIRNRQIVDEFELLALDDLQSKLAARPELPVLASAPIAAVPQATTTFPDAVILAALARHEEAAEAALVPLYLKPVHITKSKRAPLVRRA